MFVCWPNEFVSQLCYKEGFSAASDIWHFLHGMSSLCQSGNIAKSLLSQWLPFFFGPDVLLLLCQSWLFPPAKGKKICNEAEVLFISLNFIVNSFALTDLHSVKTVSCSILLHLLHLRHTGAKLLNGDWLRQREFFS